MFRRKARSFPRPYDQMHSAITKSYKRHPWIILASIVFVIFGSLPWIFSSRGVSTEDNLFYAFLLGSIGFVLVLLAVLAGENILRSTQEGEFVDKAMDFFERS